MDTEGKSVVLDENDNEISAFRLASVLHMPGGFSRDASRLSVSG